MEKQNVQATEIQSVLFCAEAAGLSYKKKPQGSSATVEHLEPLELSVSPSEPHSI